MYKDPLLTQEQNERNRDVLERRLENSAIKLINPAPAQSDDAFISALLIHCQGLRALESHDVTNSGRKP